MAPSLPLRAKDMARKNVREEGTQTSPSVHTVERVMMIDKATQTGPPTRDMGTQTEWKEDAAVQTDPETPPRASLMGLPVELRQQIFEQALTADRDNHQPRLRLHAELDMVEIMPDRDHDEYENMPSGPSAGDIRDFNNSLLRMTDLSISFIGDDQHSSDRNDIDELISGHIKLVSATCPKLQKFTLHFLWDHGRSHIENALRGQTFTAEALAALPVRDLLSIVSTAHLGPVGHLGYADLRNAVAPESCWDSRPLDDWPEISMQGQYYSGYRASIDWGQVAWRWDLHSLRRPGRNHETFEDESPRVEELD